MSDVHYYSNYANTRDIDCFFQKGGVAYHFASNGQPIPSFVTRKLNIDIQTLVYNDIPVNGEVEVMRETIRRLIQSQFEKELTDNDLFDKRESIDAMIDEYSKSFQEMARLGFVSMDMDENGVMHIIAKPKGQILSIEIFKKLPEVNDEDVRII